MRKDLPLPSNRSFGALFTIAFAALAGLALWRGNAAFGWLVAASAIFAVVTLIRPDWLMPLNRAWMALAYFLNRLVSPVVLGILYYCMVTPFGFAMRLAGKDPMRRKLDAAAGSYWIERRPPGPPPDSLRDQF
jgi:saxitoxin biosynthesis operon SxtJ-like protein